MADSPLVADMAESLLATCVASLDDPPARQLVTWNASTIAVDCAQLVVSVPDFHRTSLISGFGSMIPRSPRQQPSLPVAVFEVRLSLGCWPVVNANGNPPSAASITAAAREAYTSNWTLWHAINTAANNGTLFQSIPDLPDDCLHTKVGDWAPTGAPAGQFVTARFPVEVLTLMSP